MHVQAFKLLGFSGTQWSFRMIQVLEWLHKLQVHPQISGIIGIVHTVRLSNTSRPQSLVDPPSSVWFQA